MKKLMIALSVLATALVAFIVFRLFFSGNEGTWICQNGQWVAEGNPATPQPTSGCGEPSPSPENFSDGAYETTDGAALSNPSSKYCIDQGGKLEIRDGDKGQYGICILPDGTECEEWAYFNGQCN